MLACRSLWECVLSILYENKNKMRKIKLIPLAVPLLAKAMLQRLKRPRGISKAALIAPSRNWKVKWKLELKEKFVEWGKIDLVGLVLLGRPKGHQH
jgi:hypothetical protein